MSSALTVLLANDDPAVSDAFRDAAARDPAVQLAVTTDAIEMIELAQQLRPDAIICASKLSGIDGLELCRQVKRDPELRAAQFLLLVLEEDNGLKSLGLEAGVDDFLIKPLQQPEIQDRLRGVARIRDLLDRMRRIERRSATAREHFDQVVGLLVQLIDFGLPGAAARGNAIADLALKVAGRFEIPNHLLQDLAIAARLQEIGKVVAPDPHGGGDNAPVSDGPTYAISSTAIMQQVEWLRPAAEIVASIPENWDGTGLPARLHKGQIPLRSRILRILIDFLDAMIGPERLSPEVVASELAEHTGTRYDPVVVVHLRAVIGDVPDQDWSHSKKLVPITDLHAGMVLAEDLFTSSGVKLLRKGATVSQAMLDAIQQRHHVDPILEGAWIEHSIG
jgi:response regulator RpfG family c-di-GMP phosphodiesterase